MTDTNGPPKNSLAKEKKCCCDNYCRELSQKAFQKKPISIDLDNLLRTQLNRCLRTMDLIGYGIGMQERFLNKIS